MSAYDYERQQWVSSQRGISLRQQQLRVELDTLKSAKGEQYCRFVGIPDRLSAIAQIERELAEVRTTAAV